MLSYREIAGDLTNKVKLALERRAELLKSYDSLKSELMTARAENEQLLDMITEAYPEVDEDLSSSDEDWLHSDNEAAWRMGAHNGGRQLEPARHDDDDAQRGRRKRDAGAIGNASRLTKRRRRQGKRDDRSDPKPIEPLERDSSGRVVFPIVIGKGHDEVRIHDLGKVVWDREAYHTVRYIWTVGFRSTRVCPSMKDGNSRCLYTSEILDGGELPIFQVTAADMPDEPFRASSSSGVWKQILDILMANGVGVKTHASGPQMYGLSNLGVTKAIQELDNAGRCAKYTMQRWVEPGLELRTDTSPPAPADDRQFAYNSSNE